MKSNLLKRGLEITGALVLTLGTLSFGVTEVQMTAQHQFAPQIVTIPVGETVRFVNPTNRTHTVTADPALEKKKGDVVLPTGATPFHSGAIEPGQSFEHTFTVPGTYQYVCLPHELHGMIAQIVVRPATRDSALDAFNLLVNCELNFTNASGSKVKLETFSKIDEGKKYARISEDVLLDGGVKANLYVYYDGEYSAINFFIKSLDVYLNADAEVGVGKLFTLHHSTKEGNPLRSVSISCKSRQL